MTGSAGHFTIRAQARVKEKFLSERRGIEVIGILVGWVGWERRQAADPQVFQRAQFVIAPACGKNGRAGSDEQQ